MRGRSQFLSPLFPIRFLDFHSCALLERALNLQIFGKNMQICSLAVRKQAIVSADLLKSLVENGVVLLEFLLRRGVFEGAIAMLGGNY